MKRLLNIIRTIGTSNNEDVPPLPGGVLATHRILLIKMINHASRVAHLYGKRILERNHDEDVGIDCFSDEITVPANARSFPIPLEISVAPLEPRGVMLVPRSSITKTPLRLSNSVGIIDPGYRGEVQARVDNLSNEPFTIHLGCSLFQLVAGDMRLQYPLIVRDLPPSKRGAGSFGSTGCTSTASPSVTDYTG